MKSKIPEYEFKSGFDFQIEVVSLEALTSRAAAGLWSPHRTDFYHIFLFQNCSPTHFVDFVPIKNKPNSLLFIDRGRVHQFNKKSKYMGKAIIFTDDFFCVTPNDSKFLRSSLLFDDFIEIPVLVVKELFGTFVSLCSRIEEETKKPKDFAKHTLLKNLLHNFLLLAEREKRKHGSTKLKKGADLDYTLLFRDQVENDFQEIKTVGVYAEKLHVSEKRLNIATSNVLGKSPKEIIDDRIVLEAKRLLAHGTQAIKEISFDLGFDEPTNFIKYFRKHTGKTPVEFRKEYNPN